MSSSPWSQRRGGGEKRYLTTSSTQTSFSLTQARLTGLGAVQARIVPLQRFRGARLTFFGSGSATQTFNYRLYVVTTPLWQKAASDTPPEFELMLLGTGTATLGEAAGTSGSEVVTASELICDGLTFVQASTSTTPDGAGEDMLDAYALGDPDVYNPGSLTNVNAKLFVPDFGSVYGFLVEFDMTGATSGNCYYELTE